MNDNNNTSSRKLDHVRIVMDEDVAAKGVYTGFAAYRLPHDALPDLNLGQASARSASNEAKANDERQNKGTV